MNSLGIATRQRCSIAGAGFDKEDTTLHDAIARIWHDPRVAALVVAIDPRRALTNGLVIEMADVLCLLPRDPADQEDDYARAVRLAAPVCRAIVAQRDEAAAAALESAVQSRIISRDAIQWLPEEAGRADVALAAIATL